MAEPLKYDVPPTRTEPTANEALATLLESLHQHGFLRLATDIVNANTQIAGVLVDGLNQPGALNAMQNLSLVFKALATISPKSSILCCWGSLMPQKRCGGRTGRGR
ncbi:hypothetical protein ACFQUX_25425 [Pantoea stewartii]